MRSTRSFRSNLFSAGGVALLGVMLAGCPGSLENPERFSGGNNNKDSGMQQDSGGGGNNDSGGGVDCSDVNVETGILQADSTAGGCTGSTCHNTGAFPPDLQMADPFTRLSGMASPGCSGNYIDATNPAASVIYLKVTASPPCGARMPYNLTPLTDHQIECLEQWITEKSQ